MKGGTSLLPFCPTQWILGKPSITSIKRLTKLAYKILVSTWKIENKHLKPIVHLKFFISVWHHFETENTSYNFHCNWRLKNCPVVVNWEISLKLLEWSFFIFQFKTSIVGAQLNFRQTEKIIKTLKKVLPNARTE